MFEAPLPELLLVLQERLGEEEQDVGARSEVEVLDLRVLCLEQREEQLLKGRTRERSLHRFRQRPALLERLHEMLIAQSRRRFDRAKLHALRPARRAEVGA